MNKMKMTVILQSNRPIARHTLTWFSL